MMQREEARNFLRMTTPAGVGAVLPIEFRGREALSEPFRFEVDFLAPRTESPAFETLIGQAIGVSVRLADGTFRPFHGMVERLAEGEYDGDYAWFQAILVPDWARRSKNVRCRIFQHQTVPEILKTVLEGHKFEVRLRGSYPQRNFCVQFLESDFAFASRLMEEEGIYYFFEHAEDSHRLVLADTSSDSPEVRGKSVNFDRVAAGARNEVRVTAWKKTQVLAPTRHIVRDYCFAIPDQQLESTSTIPESVRVGQVNHALHAGATKSMEVYRYPDGSAGLRDSGGDGKEQSVDMSALFDASKGRARLQMQREAAQALEIEGASSAGHFVAGHRFALTRHGKGDGDYLLTRVQHEARLTGFRSGENLAVEYSNRFACIPRELPFRPLLRTPAPTIPGVQTATVVGVEGEEVHTDRYGRVKVQFHWDRDGKNNENSSCWIRVGQPHAGAGFGSVHLPRVGQEVLVAFHMGNPDVPYILGSVYNGTCAPPFNLPEERTRSGFKSHSLNGDSTKFSGIVFDDAPGKELLQIHSEKNLAVSAEGSQNLKVGADRKETVAGNDSLSVAGNETLKVGGVYNVTVGAVSIKGNDADFVQSAPWHFEVGPIAAAVGIKSEKVLGANFVVTGGTYDRMTVGLDNRITLLGDTHLVTGFGLDTVIGKRVVTTVGSVGEITSGDHNETVGGDLNQRIGGSQITNVLGNAKLSAKDVRYTARDEMVLKGANRVELNSQDQGLLRLQTLFDPINGATCDLTAQAYLVRLTSADTNTGTSAIIALKEGGLLITIQVGNNPDSHKIEVSEQGIHLVHDLQNYIMIDRRGIYMKAVKVEIDSDTETLVKGLTQKYKSLSEAFGE